jgi:hypothetical protein
MKNQSENLMAACAAYEAPTVEALEVSVEKGFALSSANGDNVGGFEHSDDDTWGN